MSGLAKAGARVVVNGRSEGSVAAAVETIRERVPGAEALGVTADAATEEGASIAP